jgi:pimeloyl-ACP methyl ester carboxylesterase
VIIGHSNGGMLGTRHVVDHPQTPALVLLSAGRGGARQDTSGGSEKLFAGDQLADLTARARELVAQGRGRTLMFMPGWWYVISAESFLDRLVTVPDTIALAPRITCPVLAISGDQEDRDRSPGGRRRTVPRASDRALRSLLQWARSARGGIGLAVAGRDAGPSGAELNLTRRHASGRTPRSECASA